MGLSKQEIPMVQALRPALTDLKELKDHSDHDLLPVLMDLRVQKDLSDRILHLALTDQTLRRAPMDPRGLGDLPVQALHPAHTDLRRLKDHSDHDLLPDLLDPKMQGDLTARVLLHPHMDQPFLRFQLNLKVVMAEIFLLETSASTRTCLAHLMEDLAMVIYQEATWVATHQIEASVVAMAVLPLLVVSVATALVLFPVEVTEVESRLLQREDIVATSSRLLQRLDMVAATVAEFHREST